MLLINCQHPSVQFGQKLKQIYLTRSRAILFTPEPLMSIRRKKESSHAGSYMNSKQNNAPKN